MIKASPSLLPRDQRCEVGVFSPAPLRGMGEGGRVSVGEVCGEQGPGVQGPFASPASVAQSAHSLQTSDELKHPPLLFHPRHVTGRTKL